MAAAVIALVYRFCGGSAAKQLLALTADKNFVAAAAGFVRSVPVADAAGWLVVIDDVMEQQRALLNSFLHSSLWPRQWCSQLAPRRSSRPCRVRHWFLSTPCLLETRGRCWPSQRARRWRLGCPRFQPLKKLAGYPVSWPRWSATHCRWPLSAL
eukprot:TRINITY_DN14143_c0_g1_i1.p2 TRINITY_DN14143_c0_g1~~TRINITY_DN14143_c0_g1_i1.p2  ORF type:complete len:154 (+),score=14.62 TRINITY_DN14143_c0_g1_i1:403-864(+)